jgi:4-hydroxy-3-methylbut-2-enyl diphosphate reductase
MVREPASERVGIRAERFLMIESHKTPLDVPDPHNLAFATQTTLSVDDTVEIVATLRRRFPSGAPNSSNAKRLVEVAANYGCPRSRLVQRAADMDWNWLTGAGRLGITAGTSAPELLVDELVAACRKRFDVAVEEVRTTEESVVFKLPRTLVAQVVA